MAVRNHARKKLVTLVPKQILFSHHSNSTVTSRFIKNGREIHHGIRDSSPRRDFKDPDDMITDQIAFWINSLKVREKLISKRGTKLALDQVRDCKVTRVLSSLAQGYGSWNHRQVIQLVQRRNQERGTHDTEHQNNPPPDQPSLTFKPPREMKTCENYGRPHTTVRN